MLHGKTVSFLKCTSLCSHLHINHDYVNDNDICSHFKGSVYGHVSNCLGIINSHLTCGLPLRILSSFTFSPFLLLVIQPQMTVQDLAVFDFDWYSTHSSNDKSTCLLMALYYLLRYIGRLLKPTVMPPC